MSIINNWAENLHLLLENNENNKIKQEVILFAFKRQLLNNFSEWLEKDDEHNLINQYTVDSYLEYEKRNKK